MEKYGFVYIWFDRKHKRYYIGSHWGTENDRYVCSSTWMKQAYKHRPLDFKRKVITRIYSSKQNLLNEENRWLSMIKPSEIKERYYNLRIHEFGHWSADKDKSLLVKEKNKKSDNTKGIRNYWKGKQKSEEHKAKISNALKGKPLNYTRTDETRKLISENNKRLHKEGKIGTRGKKYTEESKKKMSEWQIGNKASEESKSKMRASAAGRKWYKCEETGKRIFYKESNV